jgi:hypothetical protein
LLEGPVTFHGASALTVRTLASSTKAVGQLGLLIRGKPRFVVLEDVKGQTVTIVVETSVLGFEDFLPKVQKVVDSVKLTGS